jgi:N-methylhydantoinase B
MTTPRVDPFTMEIIKDALVAIGDEMFVATQRTSMSTIIYEVLDYACGLTDPQAQLITQGNGVTLFLGTLTSGVQAILDKFGLDGLEPGDIILHNDPYTGGGTHLSDVGQFMPIFYRGKIVGFAANKGHWTEVGGMAAGSWTTDSTEIYQEGLQFPCIKLFKRGEVDQSLVDLIAANVRTPEMSLGDMFAQAASVRLGAKPRGSTRRWTISTTMAWATGRSRCVSRSPSPMTSSCATLPAPIPRCLARSTAVALASIRGCAPSSRR